MKILLDTNFLVDVIRFKTGLSELKGDELFVLDSVLEELEKISKRKNKDAVSARLALELIEGKGLKILKSKERQADLSLLEHAKKGYAIATQDLKLKRKLKRIGARIIYIRQRKYVVKEW
jgi:rRNA-processing protein FCF1